LTPSVANLNHAALTWANLSGAILLRTDLLGATLVEANRLAQYDFTAINRSISKFIVLRIVAKVFGRMSRSSWGSFAGYARRR
jgi:Pentapeptide repeats (8 copies)